MAERAPIVDYTQPYGFPTNAGNYPDLPNIILTAYGRGFAPNSPIQIFSHIEFLPRGQPAPPNNICAALDDGRMQIPNCDIPGACVVDCYFLDLLGERADDITRGCFTIGSPPLPSNFRGIEPSAVAPGSIIQLLGSNMRTAVKARFGPAADAPAAYIHQSSDDSCQVVVPDNLVVEEPTTYSVYVTYLAAETYAAGEVLVGNITVMPPQAPAEIDTFGPDEGPRSGGTTVTFLGRYLDLTTRVQFGTLEAQRTYVAWDQVIVLSPPWPIAQSVQLTLYTPLGQVIPGRFEYTETAPSEPPNGQSFTPTTGFVSGRQVLTILGTNLDQVTSVALGSIDATDLDVTYGRITCRTPPGAPGSVVVWIRWDGGQQALPGLFTYVSVPEVLPPEEACHRTAWLSLGGQVLLLEDEHAGYVLAEFDLGWPAVREVVNNRPAGHGVDDRTRLFGARVVSAHIVAGQGGALTMDQVARAFGRFLVPDVRPELHWTLDTPDDGYQERMLVLRASEFSGPIAGMVTRDLHMAWSAPDPIIRAANETQAYARPASASSAGRRYSLTFDREYPRGGSGAETGTIVSPGDVMVQPVVRLFGPATGPTFTITVPGPPVQQMTFSFRGTFRIDAQRFITVDCDRHTVTSDDGRRLEGQVDWERTGQWPFAAPGGQANSFNMNGVGTDHITQAIAIWRDGWLTQ